jgi:hypothetical protein
MTDRSTNSTDAIRPEPGRTPSGDSATTGTQPTVPIGEPVRRDVGDEPKKLDPAAPTEAIDDDAGEGHKGPRVDATSKAATVAPSGAAPTRSAGGAAI